MYPEVIFAICSFTVLGLIGAYYLFIWLFARYHRGYTWIHRGKCYRINNVPNAEQSPYYGKIVPRDVYSESFYSTIDDPVMMQWATQLDSITKNMSDRQKATCILRFVQQNVEYTKDKTQCGKEECWHFPINTIVRKKGDCEDSSFLYACLCHLCGLDVINVDMVGHITCAVNVPSLGRKYEYEGKKYYRAETTTMFFTWIGICVASDTKIERLVKPIIPSGYFKARLKDE